MTELATNFDGQITRAQLRDTVEFDDRYVSGYREVSKRKAVGTVVDIILYSENGVAREDYVVEVKLDGGGVVYYLLLADEINGVLV